MNFERGRDVKDAVGIGIKETLPVLKEKYSFVRNLLDVTRYTRSAEEENAIEELRAARPHRFITQCGWANMNIIFDEELTTEEYSKIYVVVMKWYKKFS